MMKHAVLVSSNAPAARVMPMIALGSAVFEVDGITEVTLELLAAIRESEGGVSVATDEESFAAQRRISAMDGVYAEPSSAVVLTAFKALVAAGRIEPGHSVVGVLTGSEHRETHVLIERVEGPVEVITTAVGWSRLARFLGKSQSMGEAAA